VEEQVRESRIGNWLHSVISDFRYGFRQLRKNPGFTTVAVLTLALGIGANTAILSVIRSVLINGLPYPAAERLVIFNEIRAGSGPVTVSMPNYLDWREESRSFDGMAGYTLKHFVVTSTREPQLLRSAEVSSSFFSLLGIKPALGRLFLESEIALVQNRMLF
jgi:putative ABC transport system permease protein